LLIISLGVLAMKTSKYLMVAIMFITGFLFAIPSLLVAQEVEEEQVNYFKSNEKISCLYDNSVGVRFSNFSGYGLNYTRRFLGSYAISLSGMAQYYEYQQWKDMSKAELTEDEKDIHVNYGIELQRDLIISQNTRIYALLGAGYLKIDNRDIEGGKNTYTQTAGLGFGLDWFVHERISGFFSLAYIYQNVKREAKTFPDEEKKTTIGVGVGLSFHF
jgi:hypothetical protein